MRFSTAKGFCGRTVVLGDVLVCVYVENDQSSCLVASTVVELVDDVTIVVSDHRHGSRLLDASFFVDARTAQEVETMKPYEWTFADTIVRPFPNREMEVK